MTERSVFRFKSLLWQATVIRSGMLREIIQVIDYIEFDIHKKTISYCVKRQDGKIRDEGVIAVTRGKVEGWAAQRREPWMGAMEATVFTGWVYDTLKPYATELKVAYPPMLKAHRGIQKEKRPGRCENSG